MALVKKQVFILVKAYPQPSRAYEETVCCAGVTADGEFVRLYPIRYRHLDADRRFDRYDLVEAMGERPRGDGRPESFHVDEGSIRIVRKGKSLSPEAKVRLWLKAVSKSLEDLRNSNLLTGTSLGIIRPDAGSVRFSWRPAVDSDADEKAIGDSLRQQQSLIEQALQPLQPPEYAFFLRYTSAGKESKGRIHDWEVQAAYLNYRRQYGEGALQQLKEVYERKFVQQNLHVLLGTVHAHPRQFIIIGLLRSNAAIDAIKAQPDMFGG